MEFTGVTANSISITFRERVNGLPLLVLLTGITCLLIHLYNIEAATGLTIIIPYLGIGILVNHILAVRFQPLFISSLSSILYCYALGIIPGIITTCTVLLFMFIVRMPIKKIYRIGLIGLAVGCFVLIRIQFFHFPSLIIATPVLASILMFRFIVFSYELKIEKQQPPFLLQLSYFLNPINLAMPLFPIIDYKTWINNFRTEAYNIQYKRSFVRIVLGIFQLLLYRVVYYNVPDLSSLETSGEMLGYIFGNYAMILRMLGIFWIAIGFSGMMGFSLPPVFQHAFLVTGFTQIWRRINIYWKDFITKVFYYEIYFKLRKKVKQSLIVSSMLIFLLTWILHNYQWFWLQGTVTLKTTDFLYWLILGICISVALRIEEKYGRKTSPASLLHSLRWALQVLAMITFMSVMWWFWNSASISEWIYMSGKLFINKETLLWPAVIASAVLIVLTMGHQILPRLPLQKFPFPIALAGVVILVVLQAPSMMQIETGLDKYVDKLSKLHMNALDRDRAEQGYYERLTGGSASPWEQNINFPGRNQWFSKSEIQTNDIRKRTLKSNFKVVSPDGRSTFSTNDYGLRGPSISLVKPPRVYRIAVLGGSYEMGSGVSDNETFLRVFEKRINERIQKSDSALYDSVEVLVFAAGGYHLPQYLWLTEHEVFRFQPDLVLVFGHSGEYNRFNSVFSGLIKNGVELGYSYLVDIKKQSGATQKMDRTEIKSRLHPYDESALIWCYSSLHRVCSEKRVPAYWIYLPSLGSERNPDEFNTLNTKLSSIGFLTFDLSNIYTGADQNSLKLSEEDNHPNAKGHELISNGLLQSLGDQLSRNLRIERQISN